MAHVPTRANAHASTDASAHAPAHAPDASDASARASNSAIDAASPAVPPDSAANASRRTILDTAARLFRVDGYAAVSLRDIAAACGMKAGSLYYHFASKDAIVAEVLRIGVERVYHEVRVVIAALGPDAAPELVFRTAVKAHLRALLESQDYTSANIRIFGQVPHAVRSGHLQVRDEYERAWGEILSRLVPKAAVSADELRLTRFFLIGAMNGTLEWFHKGQAGQASVDEVAERYSTLVLRGLLGGGT
jgi:AcrR family transcriptional regulator